MPSPSNEPLEKTTLNFFASDIAWFRRRYGQGFSEKMREVIRAHVNAKRLVEEAPKPIGEAYLTEDFDE